MPQPLASMPLSYQHHQDWRHRHLLVGPSNVPKAAYCVAIVHAGWAALLALVTAIALSPSDARAYEPISWMLGLQLPTGGVALLLAILGHRYVDGRKLAGPAMWIVGFVPGASCTLHLLAALAANHITGQGGLIATAVILIDAVVVLALRNRILKAPQGPLPVIPILDPQDPQVFPAMNAQARLSSDPIIPYGEPLTPAGPGDLIKYLWIFIPITVVANAFFFYLEQADRSFSAMAIAFVVGPIANLLLIAAALLVGLIPRRHRQSASLSIFLLTSTGLPTVAAALNVFALFMIDLHGC